MAHFRRNNIATLIAALLFKPALLLGAKISEIQETGFWDHVREFVTLSSPTIVNTLLGCSLLGILGGVIGSFLLLRRMSLVGDALGHALLPGIAIAFLIVGYKSIFHLFVGALIAGLVYSIVLSFVTRQRRIKPDSALGLTFTAFFGIGIVVMSYIQSSPTGAQSGLDKFLFGQAAALSRNDVVTVAVVLAITVALTIMLFRRLTVFSFDAAFARAIGISTRAYHYGMMTVVTVAIIISVQAVGVVLVAALLIIPAAAAYLLAKRLKVMIWLAGLFGLVSGASGAFLSYVLPGIPTGPIVVLSAAGLFGAVILAAPRQGIVPRWLSRRRRRARLEDENLLKVAVEFMHSSGESGGRLDLNRFAEFERVRPHELLPRLRKLQRSGQLSLDDSGAIALTDIGRATGERVLRNHTLWEIYLSRFTDIAPDHVHYDAERIEHVLTPEIVRQLEQELSSSQLALVDPHRGKL